MMSNKTNGLAERSKSYLEEKHGKDVFPASAAAIIIQQFAAAFGESADAYLARGIGDISDQSKLGNKLKEDDRNRRE